MTNFSDQDRIKHPVEEYAQLQGGIFFFNFKKSKARVFVVNFGRNFGRNFIFVKHLVT